MPSATGDLLRGVSAGYRRLGIASLTLAAAAVRAYRLGADSLWYDETVSAYLATQPVPEMVAHTARDIHPPFYYLLLHLWTRVAGTSEFALAWPSYAAGVLLVPLMYALVRRVVARYDVAFVAALLLAFSPYHVWYAQEVRMYSLATLLTTIGGWAAWKLLEASCAGKPTAASRPWWTFVLTSVIGMYTLYYYAFWLVVVAAFVALALTLGCPRHLRARLNVLFRPWVAAGALTLVLYTPWLPVFYRQVTEPPVPPWRVLVPWGEMLQESAAALAFGQSLDPGAVPGALGIVLAVYLVGAIRLATWRHIPRPRVAAGYLVAWTWGPVALLGLLSRVFQPLYHVRYVFVYSAPFYGVLAAGVVAAVEEAWRLKRQARAFAGLSAVAAVCFVSLWGITAGLSLFRFWHDPQYRADDFRSAMAYLETHWHPGDALLVNAGYVYTAVNYYFHGPIAWQGRLVNYGGLPAPTGLVILQSGSLEGPPSLGWGDPESDFYLTNEAETAAALERVARQHPRLWVLRAYDTVTDPGGFIRRWLAAHGLLFEDRLLAGPGNFRLQGWLMPAAFTPKAPQFAVPAEFVDPLTSRPWVRLKGWDRFAQEVRGGEPLFLTLYLQATEDLAGPVRISVGLFDEAGRQWAVEDRAPLGPRLSLRELASEPQVAVPVRLSLPPGLPPGAYRLRLKVYRPDNAAALRAVSDATVPGELVELGTVTVAPTPSSYVASLREARVLARAGPLRLLAAHVPQGPFQPGQLLEVELVWQTARGEAEDADPVIIADGAVEDLHRLGMHLPVRAWPQDALLRDVHRLMVRPEARPGTYPLAVELHRNGGVMLWDGFLWRRTRVRIGTLEVVDRPRLFAQPPVEHEVAALFDGVIELVGYDIERLELAPGESLRLRLVWHALERPSRRYKVFTHLVGSDGKIHGQRDLEPGEGMLPTNGWAPGEYVVMEYDVPVNPDAVPGVYELRLGLYEPDTGRRAEVEHPSANLQERYLLVARVTVRPR